MKDSFIPKPYQKEPVTIRIDVEKLEKIDKLAQEHNVNRSEFINRCIDYAISNLKWTQIAAIKNYTDDKYKVIRIKY